MPRLRDGTVVPSYLGVKDTASDSGAPGFFDEVRILVGEVTEIHYSDSPSNNSGLFTEYTVNVWRRQSSGAQERLAFHCSQSDSFGSCADWFRFAFRPATSNPDQQPLANGATVLVACLNGDRSNAYIIGGIPQPTCKQSDPPEAEGRYLNSRFNGVEAHIKDDGGFELVVPGATDTDGKPDQNRDENNKGSHVVFAANGDITIEDKAGESVTISPAKKTIEIAAGDQTSTISKKWKLKAATVEVEANEATIDAATVNLGGNKTSINPLDGVVVGTGVDTFTGVPYVALGNTSQGVKAKK